MLFHVTFQSNIQRIVDTGIVPNKPKTWTTRLGKLPKGFIYSFTEYEDAAKWAFKQDFEFKTPTVIVCFVEDFVEWAEDVHPESKLGYTGKWLKRKEGVPGDSIIRIETKTCWLDWLRKNKKFN